MRIHIALTIYVSLTMSAVVSTCSAEDLPLKAITEWNVAHTAGLAALQNRQFDKAIDYLELSWPLAHGRVQKGVSATDIGQAYRQMGSRKQAKDWLGRAYDIWRTDPHTGYNMAVAASGLGALHRDAGDYAHAEAILREALNVPNTDADSQGMIRNNLADLVREEGRVAEAHELFLETFHQVAGPSRQRVNALIGLAEVEHETGDRDGSVKKWNEVLEITRDQRDELSEAIASRGLASMWMSAGDYARAEPLLRRSLMIMETNPEATPVDLANALSSMALLYRAKNKLAQAEAAWSKALQLERKEFGDLHPQTACLMEMLADVYSARGDNEMARDYATQAVEAMKRLLGEDALPTAAAFANRAGVERRASDLEAAARDYERALDIAHAHPGNDSLEKGLIERYTSLLKSMHRDREAKALSALAGSFRPN